MFLLLKQGNIHDHIKLTNELEWDIIQDRRDLTTRGEEAKGHNPIRQSQEGINSLQQESNN